MWEQGRDMHTGALPGLQDEKSWPHEETGEQKVSKGTEIMGEASRMHLMHISDSNRPDSHYCECNMFEVSAADCTVENVRNKV